MGCAVHKPQPHSELYTFVLNACLKSGFTFPDLEHRVAVLTESMNREWVYTIKDLEQASNATWDKFNLPGLLRDALQRALAGTVPKSTSNEASQNSNDTPDTPVQAFVSPPPPSSSSSSPPPCPASSLSTHPSMSKSVPPLFPANAPPRNENDMDSEPLHSPHSVRRMPASRDQPSSHLTSPEENQPSSTRGDTTHTSTPPPQTHPQGEETQAPPHTHTQPTEAERGGQDEDEGERDEGESAEYPQEFLCPITYAVMRDPVLLLGDGQTYERTAIERWLQQRRSRNQPATSPSTGAQLDPDSLRLVSNVALKKLIEDYIAKHPELQRELHEQARQEAQDQETLRQRTQGEIQELIQQLSSLEENIVGPFRVDWEHERMVWKASLEGASTLEAVAELLIKLEHSLMDECLEDLFRLLLRDAWRRTVRQCDETAHLGSLMNDLKNALRNTALHGPESMKRFLHRLAEHIGELPADRCPWRPTPDWHSLVQAASTASESAQCLLVLEERVTPCLKDSFTLQRDPWREKVTSVHSYAELYQCLIQLRQALPDPPAREDGLPSPNHTRLRVRFRQKIFHIVATKDTLLRTLVLKLINESEADCASVVAKYEGRGLQPNQSLGELDLPLDAEIILEPTNTLDVLEAMDSALQRLTEASRPSRRMENPVQCPTQ